MAHRGGRRPDWERVDRHRHPYHAEPHMLGEGCDGRQSVLLTWQQHVWIDGDRSTVHYQPTGHT